MIDPNSPRAMYFRMLDALRRAAWVVVGIILIIAGNATFAATAPPLLDISTVDATIRLFNLLLNFLIFPALKCLMTIREDIAVMKTHLESHRDRLAIIERRREPRDE